MIHPTLRRCIFWTHLVVGIVAGLIIFLLALTGLLLSFETQIINQVERSMVRSSAEGKTLPLKPSEIIAAFENAGLKGKPTTLNYQSHPDAPVTLLAGRGNQQLFHPTTGEPMGKGAVGTRRFFQITLSMHRYMTWPMQQGQGNASSNDHGFQWREVGGQIIAGGTLAFLGLLMTGLVIWIPKKRVWRAFKVVLTLQPRLKGRARDWNWHNVAGIWASPFILLICLTGLIMAYPWANGLLYSAFGESVPKRQENAGQRGGREGGGSSKILSENLDGLADFAKRQMPDWQTISMELPTDPQQPLVVTVSDAGRGRPDRREKFTVTPGTFEIVKHETYADLKPVAKTRQLVRWIHTGEIGGWVGQLLMALTTAAILVLVWTGFALSYRRFFPARKKQAAA